MRSNFLFLQPKALKKPLFTTCLIFCGLLGWSQIAIKTLPLYERFPAVPPFTLMLVPDGFEFKKENLRKKRPVVVVIFSPDCDHCKTLITELLHHYTRVRKAEIIMASPTTFDLISKFYEENEIWRYSAIKMGRDATYSLGTFYGVRNYPAVYVYDRKGMFVKGLDGNATVQEIAELIKK